jgi:Na+-transporting methylmalonyl-CoA/oxaloacetate decarboxylase gamma subunit
MDPIAITLEQLGVAGITVVILLWVIAYLLRHISKVEVRRDEDRQYERQQSQVQQETLVKVTLTMDGLKEALRARL